MTPVSQLPKAMVKEYSALLDGGEGGAPVQLPLRAEDYEPDVSLGYVSEGKLQACALFTYQDGQLVLSYAQRSLCQIGNSQTVLCRREARPGQIPCRKPDFPSPP